MEPVSSLWRCCIFLLNIIKLIFLRFIYSNECGGRYAR